MSNLRGRYHGGKNKRGGRSHQKTNYPGARSSTGQIDLATARRGRETERNARQAEESAPALNAWQQAVDNFSKSLKRREVAKCQS